jgi:hypothetical protein
MNKNLITEKPKDVSLFTRWVKDFDEKDKFLNRGVRKRKWMLIVAGIFFLFVLSFVLFPTSHVKRKPLDSPFPETEVSGKESSARSAFELPVDSFEIQLKTIINEDISKKE